MAKSKENKPSAAEVKAIAAVDTAFEGMLTKWEHYGGIASSIKYMDIQRIPCGIWSIDRILGGGLAVGRLHEFFGKESTGKSTLADIYLAASQRAFPDKYVGIIDAENSFDEIWATKLGIDKERLVVLRPDVARECLDAAFDLASCGKISTFFLDSVASLVAAESLEDTSGQGTAPLARLLSEDVKRLVKIGSTTNTAMIFSNQIRVNPRTVYGNPEYVTGGNAVKFYASVRLELGNAGYIREGESENSVTVGYRSKLVCKKNKTARPMQTAEVDFYYDQAGFSKEADIIDVAVSANVITKAGSWLAFEPTGEKFQGRAKFIAILRENPDFYNKILSAVNEVYNG